MTITFDQLKRICPEGNDNLMRSLVTPLNDTLPSYGIDTRLRISHFLAQAAHETGHFRTLVEYGPDSYFTRYDGRRDLENSVPGDGLRYKGRGIFQLTGRINYRVYGKRLNIDLENNPALAAQGPVSVKIACEYWKAKGLSGWADRDDVKEITRRINGGYNGLQDRIDKLARAKSCFPLVSMVYDASQSDANDITEEVPDAPIAPEPVAPWYQQINKETILHWVGGGGVFSGIWTWISKKFEMIDTPAEVGLIIGLGFIGVIVLALVLRHLRQMKEVGQH
jgi:predicted chitinase